MRTFFLIGLLVSAVLPAQADQLSIVYPLVGPKLSSSFGLRRHPARRAVRHHAGVDLAAPAKSHVRAVLDGVVIFAGEHGGYGKLVTVQHGATKASLYGHLSEIRVNIGDRVQAGQIIGRVGSTGISTGPHLHFEWRESGRAINPLEMFPSLAQMPNG